jgi:aspartate/methionine/tyrosine aminotransferase
MWQSDYIKTIPFSGIRKIYQRAVDLEKNGHDIIHLEVGEPDFDTPAHIKEAARAALDKGLVHYASNYGVPELRRLIAEKMARENHLDIDPEREVIVTAGATQAIYLALQTVLNAGDEVLVSDPGFVNYFNAPRLLGVSLNLFELREERAFKPDITEIRSLISKKTKMIILNSPNNPIGSIFTREDLEPIADIAVEHNLMIVSDEVYERIIFDDGKHVSIAALDGLRDRVITINSFSKTYAMTGWRLGYVVAAPATLDAMIKAHQQTVGTCCSFGQYGAIAALEGPQDCVRDMVAEFERRRNFVYERLKMIQGIRCIRPGGALYLYPHIGGTGLSGEEFAMRLLEKEGVATVPGIAFGPSGNAFVRISIANSMERLRVAMDRIAAFVRSL